MVIALYISFWLQLETPSTAALTVGILALPTRAQGSEKAGFRLIATVIGASVSIAIVGLFAQSDAVLLAVFAAWIGLCVYIAGTLDGNRAYGASLGATTVAVIAIQQMDSPQQVFEAAVARGSAIGIGVLAVTFVNSLFTAPSYYPKITTQLEGLHRRVMDYAQSALHGQRTSITTAARLLRDITALRPEISSLAAESVDGRARSAAARTAMMDLIAQMSVARAVEISKANSIEKEETFSHLDTDASTLDGKVVSDSDHFSICFAWLKEELSRKNIAVQHSLGALRAGKYPPCEWSTPPYRSHRIASESGVRAALYFGLSSIILITAGWPTAEVCLSLVAVLIGLSATVSDVLAFTKLALIAVPISSLLAGILEFVVLDGATGFPLLVIALAPFVIGLAFLMTFKNPIISTVGRLCLIFTIALFSPNNPQTYDPQTFLFTCLFACLATALLLGAQLLIPPLSNDRRLSLLLREARRELDRIDPRRAQSSVFLEATFRDAARIGKMVTLSGDSVHDQQVLAEGMYCFDRSAIFRWCGTELDRLADGPYAHEAYAARKALYLQDQNGVFARVFSLLRAPQQHPSTVSAAAALVVAVKISDAGSVRNKL